MPSNPMQKNSNPLIFIVEDNVVYSKLLTSYLKTNKYTNVETFTTGEDALKAMSRNPDIVIQDYLLDGMDGVQVLKEAKKIAPDVEFLFLSGQDNIEIAINTMKYGAHDYIVKNQLALKKMILKIERILATKGAVVSKKRFKKGVVLFFIVLILFIIALITLIAVLFPKQFGF